MYIGIFLFVKVNVWEDLDGIRYWAIFNTQFNSWEAKGM